MGSAKAVSDVRDGVDVEEEGEWEAHSRQVLR